MSKLSGRPIRSTAPKEEVKKLLLVMRLLLLFERARFEPFNVGFDADVRWFLSSVAPRVGSSFPIRTGAIPSSSALSDNPKLKKLLTIRLTGVPFLEEVFSVK